MNEDEDLMEGDDQMLIMNERNPLVDEEHFYG